MLALVITSSPGQPSFVPAGLVGLPLAVDSAGLVLPFDDELRVWINRPGETSTIQLRVLPSRRIEELAALPLVAAGAVQCGEGFIVTGSDASGRAMVLGSGRDGSVVWQHKVDGPQPIRWPVPCCVPQPAIVWQTVHGKLELAEAGENGLVRRGTFEVGGPPLEVAGTTHSIFAVWSDVSGIRTLRIADGPTRPAKIAASYVSEIAAGSCGENLAIATVQNDAVLLALAGPDGSAVALQRQLEVQGKMRGSLTVVSGAKPLVWMRGGDSREEESPRARSILTGPYMHPIEINGLVYSVASRDDMVVLLGSNELLFLRRVDG
jgi:hypothetical protein